eukprot:TRINITY_DN10626_c0_g1_i1.p1 TRINITY_DN10626_c0_g1~~TRINITY_DN10626_c0_g1_i1.p1  ORF type:complete len:215 (+),score=23.52 TRINITY_DN10626_c0_g1_i1:1-645(+)
MRSLVLVSQKIIKDRPKCRANHRRRSLRLPSTYNSANKHFRSYILMSQQVSLLSQADAKSLDEDLMGPEFGFSVDQLMELAGLSCACSIFEVYKPQTHPKVLIVCGPGNNGGDGLVCARHLHHFGYTVEVVYPKRTEKQLYKNITRQCEKLNISIKNSLPEVEDIQKNYNLIVDAIFGFSFAGEIRAPFDKIITAISSSRVSRRKHRYSQWLGC